jgi:hypothetical protein
VIAATIALYHARTFLTGQGIDGDAIAPQVQEKFMSAFIRPSVVREPYGQVQRVFLVRFPPSPSLLCSHSLPGGGCVRDGAVMIPEPGTKAETISNAIVAVELEAKCKSRTWRIGSRSDIHRAQFGLLVVDGIYCQ